MPVEIFETKIQDIEANKIDKLKEQKIENILYNFKISEYEFENLTKVNFVIKFVTFFFRLLIKIFNITQLRLQISL